MVATYKTSPVFEFFLVGNAITCGYSIASLPFVSKLVEGYILDVLDLVNLVVSMASASAATAIGYLGKEGNDQIGWMKVCPYYEKFCNRVVISLVCSYVGLLFCLLICAFSSVYKTRLSNNA
ncbi:CASP-like protein 1F1 [Elaeis guineensis]|uniref:CASP-like protein 1F1 n=1 Tax=Elaeis guineensis var. tenera TaxID=51953 RepID=UPI003C6D63CC